MPELPEVETVTNALNLAIKNSIIKKVVVYKKDLRIAVSENFKKTSKGAQIVHVKRRAKYGQIYLNNNYVIVFHLGMSGKIIINKYHSFKKKKHDHVVFEMQFIDKSKENIILSFNDPRRFGFINTYKNESKEYNNIFDKLGPEPLSNKLDIKDLKKHFRNKSTSIKATLLDQKIISGLGNIYVCESLFSAYICPEKKACNLSENEIEILVTKIKEVLLMAIKAGGSTIQDHKNINGEIGYFQNKFLVYDREGKNCKNKNCKEKIKRIILNGRSTYYCSNCQK